MAYELLISGEKAYLNKDLKLSFPLHDGAEVKLMLKYQAHVAQIKTSMTVAIITRVFVNP